MEIYTLDHLYDFLEKEHGYELVEIAQKLIEEYVAHETQALKNNIDTYEEGFGEALTFLNIYSEKYGRLAKPFDSMIKAEKLSRAIYSSKEPNYSVEVK